MSFQWVRFLDVAEQLARTPLEHVSEHAQLRSAISRAYYAAYHNARVYVEDNGFRILPSEVFKQGSHQKLYTWFQQPSQSRAAKTIGRDLQELHKYRVGADYGAHNLPYQKTWQEAANDSLVIAHRIVATIASLRRP